MIEKVQSIFAVRKDETGFTVWRDAEPLKTPRTISVTLPTERLAEAIAVECRGQGGRLDLRKMPLTQMALTSIDITMNHRQEVVDGIVRHAESELVCQRATEPPDLTLEQDKMWQPYIDWCRKTFHADLRTGSGVIPFAQRPEAVEALKAYVETFDAFRLTAVSEVVGILGSIVLGLALVTKYASVESVVASSELDQLWQGKKWGSDPATENRHAGIKQDLKMCLRWLDYLS